MTEAEETTTPEWRKYEKGRITVEMIMEALPRFNGNLSAVAIALKCSRGTIYNRIHGSEELQEMVANQRESTLDDLESELFAQAMNGNITALIFALKTAGFRRGYGDRTKLDLDGNFVGKLERDREEKEDAAYVAGVLAELEAMKKADAPPDSEDSIGDSKDTE